MGNILKCKLTQRNCFLRSGKQVINTLPTRSVMSLPLSLHIINEIISVFVVIYTSYQY